MNNTTKPPVVKSSSNYASFGRRFVASLLDGIIVGMVTGGLMLIIGIIVAVSIGAASSSSNSSLTLTTVQMLVQGISYLISAFYYVYFIGKNGQTIGKMALGIKVVKLETQAPPGYVGAFLREIVGKILSAAVFGLGYFWMLWDGQKQTWHDKIAGTIVIRV